MPRSPKTEDAPRGSETAPAGPAVRGRAVTGPAAAGRKGSSRGRALGACLTVLIVVAVVILIAIKGSPGNGGNGGGGSGGNNSGAPRAIIQMDKNSAYENAAVRFSGAASQGNISEFRWDFGDGVEADGPTVQHSYASVGKYTVTLTVVDLKGRSHMDTAYMHIDHHEGESGAISIGQSKNYVVPVDIDCMGARATLTYPTGPMIGGKPGNDLDIALLYPNGTAYSDSKDQPPAAGNTQVRELTIPSQEMAAAFYKDWTVRVSASSGLNVDFDLEMEVTY